MGQIRTPLSSADHLELFGAGNQPVLKHWRDILKHFYADILASGQVEQAAGGLAVRWSFPGQPVAGGAADEQDLTEAQNLLREANARVDAVLETMDSIKRRGARGGNYRCSSDEYEAIKAIFPQLSTSSAPAVGIPAQPLNTVFSVLKMVRNSLQPDALTLQHVVKTSEGPCIIGWGLTKFDVPIVKRDVIVNGALGGGEEGAKHPAETGGPEEEPGEAEPEEGPEEEPEEEPPPPSPPPPPPPPKRRRRFWLWLLVCLAILALLLAFILWLRGCSLPYDPHEMPLGTEHLVTTPSLEALAYEPHEGPMGTEAVVRVVRIDNRPGTTPGAPPQPPSDEGIPGILSLQREGFRFETTNPDGESWKVQPDFVFRRDYREGEDKVGVDLWWNKDYVHQPWNEITAELGRARCIVRRGEGDVLYHEEHTHAKVYYWIGIELDRPQLPEGVKVRVLEPTPENLPPGWREVKEVLTLKRGKQERYFYIFLMLLDKLPPRVKVKLSGPPKQGRVIERVIERVFTTTTGRSRNSGTAVAK